MVRPLRIEYEDAMYHVTSRGNHQNDIFFDDADRHAFLEILTSVVRDFAWLCHGYCLMGNHYHLIIQTPHANLCSGMRQLNGVFTQYSNRKHGRSGHLLQGRYTSIIVDADTYLLALSRYVVLNPVRAGMVDDVSQWAWSSYRATAGLVAVPALLTTEMILDAYSTNSINAQQRYTEFVADGLHKPAVWLALQQQIFLGQDDFVADVQHKAVESAYNSNIPKAQQRMPATALADIEAMYEERNKAIVAAYQTGAYSYDQIALYFHLHASTVGRIIRAHRGDNHGVKAL
ncbi:MAG: transposase [Mariprofundus sp.]